MMLGEYKVMLGEWGQLGVVKREKRGNDGCFAANIGVGQEVVVPAWGGLSWKISHIILADITNYLVRYHTSSKKMSHIFLSDITHYLCRYHRSSWNISHFILTDITHYLGR